MSADAAALAEAAARLSCPRIRVAARAIAPGDEDALLPTEAASIPAPLHVRRASGAARIAARGLLAALGFPGCPVPKLPSGAPLWPAGVVGSLAHDGQVAVAAVARSADIAALGIDVEPNEPLPAELQDLVPTPRERCAGTAGRPVFAAKEAVYKAVAALDGTLLDYREIETDLGAGRATIADGRSLTLRYTSSPRVIVLALIPGGQG